MVRSMPRARSTAGPWFILAAILSLVPVLGIFTTTRIFFVRDLGLFFWSRHLWLRHTIASGVFPLWDPYVAAGQSAIADALNQVLMPVTLAIRLLPSDVVSFNLWVATPLPLAAAGTWLFLRRAQAPAAAALGAILFALSGPMVASLNAPNLSWSVAAMPWVLWAVARMQDGPSASRCGVAAIAIALQALAGEPVTLASTGAVLLVLAVWAPEGRLRRLGVVAVCMAAGGLLGAAQLLPTVAAGMRANRGALGTPDFWSLHPLGLLETVMPHVFGNYYDAFLAEMPWMTALNSGREPFYYSLYLGPLTLLLAATGLVARPRRTAPWAIIGVAFTVAALGAYTPVYPLARRLVPPLAYFRFPVKYIVVSAFAAATMAADGWAAALDRDSRRETSRVAAWMGAVAIVAAVVAVVAVVFTPASLRAADALARRVHVADPAAAAAYLVRGLPPLAARGAGLLLIGCGLLALVARHTTRSVMTAYVLLAAASVDVAVINHDLNLTSPLDKMSPPSWYRALASGDRLYIGGRVHGYMNPKDPDATDTWDIPAEETAVEGRLELNAEIPMAPSGWRVREALSYDLPVLWPADYAATVRRFDHASAAERLAFLRRSGVRWCVLPDVREGWPIEARIPHWRMALFDCDPRAARAIVTTRVAAGQDEAWQREGLFDPSLPDDALRVDRVPPVAGVTGPPEAPAVRVTFDDGSEVGLAAALDREGYVVLRDSFDPAWRADVDGMPAEVVRANGRYRAIRLAPGRHVIRFEYRPRTVAAGLMLSGSTALVLVIAVFARRRRDRGAAAGFTLVELMIVMAIIGILLALAFARYRNMQAAGNETSAISALRSIAVAQWQFSQTCGNQKYAATLAALGQPVPTTGAAFLSPDLTAGDVVRHSGYDFRIAAKPLNDAPPACNGAAVAAGYAATADPEEAGRTGSRFFAINTDRILYEDPEQTFTEKMPETGPPPHGIEVK